ncbi:4-oxalocrotonate tautomerase [Lactobacillus sp. ZJLC28-8]|uniref:2-hydroxymuconate tautomerase n=1 Tax=unclassified Levilactobacillus TaxID=2767918 RepID=UPI001456CC34|nr:4-oxalocrotonate tautomerase [Lactobacillus sp. HBUAS51381]
MANVKAYRYNSHIYKEKGTKNMPIVNIDLIAGRSQDQLKALVQDVTTAVTKNTGAPAEHVHVILREMQPNRYGVAGVLKSDEK